MRVDKKEEQFFTMQNNSERKGDQLLSSSFQNFIIEISKLKHKNNKVALLNLFKKFLNKIIFIPIDFSFDKTRNKIIKKPLIRWSEVAFEESEKWLKRIIKQYQQKKFDLGISLKINDLGIVIFDIDDVETFKKALNKNEKEILKDFEKDAILTVKSIKRGFHIYINSLLGKKLVKLLNQGITNHELKNYGFEIKNQGLIVFPPSTFQHEDRIFETKIFYLNPNNFEKTEAESETLKKIYELIEKLKIEKLKKDTEKIEKEFERKRENYNILKQIIHEVKKKISFRDLVPEKFAKQYTNYATYHCVIHPPDKHPSFAVYRNLDYEYGYDFHDGNSYDVIAFYQKIYNCGFIDALKNLCKLANIEFPEKPTIKKLEIDPFCESKKIFYKPSVFHKGGKKITIDEIDENLNFIFRKEIEKVFFEGVYFPYQVIPQKLKEVFQNFQRALGVPFEIVFTAALPVLGAALGNAVKVEVKPGYVVNFAFWVGVIMPSGSGKTPLIKLLTTPVLDKQQRTFKENEKNLSTFIVTDTTLEGLHKVLSHNERGILWTPQELGAVLGIINEYKKKGADRQRLIQLFDGNPVVIMRKTEGLTFIPTVEVNLLGGIQPEIFPKIFNESFFKDGLIQRFLWISGESDLLSEEGINDEGYTFYKNLVESFLDFSLKKEGGEISSYKIKFSRSAKKKFIEKGNILRKISENFTSELKTFISKIYFYYLPRLAGLLACLQIYEIEGNLNKIQKEEIEIDQDIFENALLLAFYYIEAGRRVFELYGRKEFLDEYIVTVIKIITEFVEDKEIQKIPLKEIVEKFKDFLKEKFNFLSFSVDVNSKTIAKILRKLGFKVEKGSKGRTFIYFTPEAKELIRSFSEYRSYHSVKKKPEILKLVEDLKKFNDFSEQFIESASAFSVFENFDECYKKLQKESKLTSEQLEVINKYWK